MKTKAPAFQFYPQDYLSSARVAEMTLEEEGAYIRLLCYCWTTGSIPADPLRCARLAGKGCTVETATAVQRAFYGNPTDATQMLHDRIETEREKQRLHREQASVAGRKSAELRRASVDKQTTSNGRSTGVQRKVNSSSSSSDEDDTDFESHGLPEDLFDTFWKVFPRKVAQGNAQKAWKKAIKICPPEKIVAAAKAYAAFVVGKDKEYVKHPATWLNAKSWNDELPSAPTVCRWPYDGTDIKTEEGMALLTKTFLEGLHRA